MVFSTTFPSDDRQPDVHHSWYQALVPADDKDPLHAGSAFETCSPVADWLATVFHLRVSVHGLDHQDRARVLPIIMLVYTDDEGH